MARGVVREQARWSGPDRVWLDHAALRDDDLGWLLPARSITFWAVRVPPGFLARLPTLELLDLRGGSATDVDVVSGCAGLRALSINQVRGVDDLSTVVTLTGLERLDLYGLPRVTHIPSLEQLRSLQYAAVGSMKGLVGLTGLLEAPALTDLVLLKRVGLAPRDPAALRDHPTLQRFTWFAEDVPDSTWVPVRDLVDKPPAPATRIEDWSPGRR